MSAAYCARLLVVVLAVHDHADGHAEELVDLAHPVGVAAGQVVVHRDDVHALAGERVEVDGQGGDQGLALAGLHLGDLAVVQHHAADQLHVEMPLAERAPGGLAHHGEGLGQQVVQRGAAGQPLAELGGLRPQRLVRQRLHGRLEGVDLRHPPLIALERTIVGGAEHGAGDGSEHGTFSDGRRLGPGSLGFPGNDPIPGSGSDRTRAGPGQRHGDVTGAAIRSGHGIRRHSGGGNPGSAGMASAVPLARAQAPEARPSRPANPPSQKPVEATKPSELAMKPATS